MQVCAVALIIAYSTYQLFLGHFEESMTALPLLIGYYLFVTARTRKKKSDEEYDESDDSEQ